LKILSFVLLVFNLLSFCASAIEFTAEESAFIAEHQRIKIHNEMNWAPFNFYENGKPQGISIDVMDKVATLTGLNIEYISGPSWNEFLTMMAKDELDVMLNMVELPERQKDYLFTTAYAKSLSGIFVSNNNSKQYFDFSDLKGKVVAIPRGFDLSIKIPKYYPELKILLVDDILEAIEAVHSGKADALIEELSVVDYISTQRMIPDLRLVLQIDDPNFISNLSIATNQNSPVLHAIIQKGLNAIPMQTLNGIMKKWLFQMYERYEKSMVQLNVTEKEYLYLNNQVDICVDPTWPPLDFIDENGKHSGLSASLINKLATRVGVTLNLVPSETWAETLQLIQQNKCTVIPLMNETQAALHYLDFSENYFQFATAIATRKNVAFIGDYSELYGKKVALQSYFFITDYIRNNHPKIEIIEVKDTKEALQMVNEQRAFATIDGLPNIVNNIEALALENIKIVGTVPQQNSMKMGVRKGNEILLSIFNKGIASLSEKEKIILYKQWFDIEISNRLLDRSLMMKMFAIFTLLLILILWRHITIKKHALKLSQLNKKLKHISSTDHLTKIYNRQKIESYLAIEMKKSQQTQHPLSLLLLDIDYFKRINDTFGHLTGDAVLQKISTLMSTSIRRSDYVGRWGGEEFMLIIPNVDIQHATIIANHLREKIAQFDYQCTMPITASIGVAQYQQHEKINELISRVDTNLYHAKHQGRNQVINATPREKK